MSLHLISPAFIATGCASAGAPAASRSTLKTTVDTRCIRTPLDRNRRRRRLSHKGEDMQSVLDARTRPTDQRPVTLAPTCSRQGGLSQFERAHVQPCVSRVGHGNACPALSTVKSIFRQANPLPLRMLRKGDVVDSTLYGMFRCPRRSL